MSFAVHREICGPTAVTHCVAAQLSGVAGARPHLLVVRSACLDLYVLSTAATTAPASAAAAADGDDDAKHGDDADDDSNPSAKLLLVCCHILNEAPTDVAVLKRPLDSDVSVRDTFLLSFAKAKVCALEFDPDTSTLYTASLHNYESKIYASSAEALVYPKFPEGYLASDPLGRCALFVPPGGQHIVVLKATDATGYLAEDTEQNGEIEADGKEPTEQEGKSLLPSNSAAVNFSYLISFRDGAIFPPTLNVLHACLLDGTSQPTVLILHASPDENQDEGDFSPSLSVAAVSLDLFLQKKYVVWRHTSGLPKAIKRLIPAPAPAGGALALGPRGLALVSQSGVLSREMDLGPEPNAVWLEPTLALLVGRRGELIQISIKQESGRALDVCLTRVGSAALPSGIVNLGPGFCFLGSRVGDSVLVHHKTTIQKEQDEKQDGTDGPIMARLQSGEFGNAAEQEEGARTEERDVVDEEMDEEMKALFDISLMSKSDDWTMKRVNLTVCDSLVCLAPMVDMAVLPPSGDSEKTLQPQHQPILAACGHSRGASLGIIHRAIPQEIVTDVELVGCIGTWAVYDSLVSESTVTDTDGGDAEGAANDGHGFLFLTVSEETMVLETGDDLQEVSGNGDFYTEGPTICAGNVCTQGSLADIRIVQVYRGGILLLKGIKLVSKVDGAEIFNDTATEISASEIVDPFVLLRMNDGSIRLYSYDPISETLTQALLLGGVISRVSACTLCSSTARCFSKKALQAIDYPGEAPSVLLLLCSPEGDLQIIRLPEQTVIFASCGLSEGSALLQHDGSFEENRAEKQEEEGKDKSRAAVKELAIVQSDGIEPILQQPVLVALLADGSLLCYKITGIQYSHASQPAGAIQEEDAMSVDEELEPRFRGFSLVRQPCDYTSLIGHTAEVLESGSIRELIPFRNVGGVSGVFVCGECPLWGVMDRGHLRWHRMAASDSVEAFTPFHNASCEHGYIAATTDGFLKICTLSSELVWGADWPVQKVPVRATPHSLALHLPTRTAALITSTVTSSHKDNEADAAADDVGRYDSRKQFEVQIWSCISWLCVHSHRLNVGENGIVVRPVVLRRGQAAPNVQVLAVGTAFLGAEDELVTGRILLLEVKRVPRAEETAEKPADKEQDDDEEGEDEAPEDAVEARVLHSKDIQGACTTLGAVDGYLLATVGSKVIICVWNGTDLATLAFFDQAVYATSINIVKSFVLIGDIYKSLFFLRWKEDGRSLNLLSKDFESKPIVATEFIIDGSTLYMLSADSSKNIQIFNYSDTSADSWKGQKLLLKSEANVGTRINRFQRFKVVKSSHSAKQRALQRHGALYCSVEGAIGFVSPMDEMAYRRLSTLVSKMVTEVVHVGGVLPSRRYVPLTCWHVPAPNRILDGSFLWTFLSLPEAQKAALAKATGTTTEQILQNLRDI